MEYSLGKLNIAFGNKIPQSFLPYPKDILLEAFELINEDSYKLGDKRMMNLMHESAAELITFINDDRAFILAAEKYNDPKWRKAFVQALKEFQKMWIIHKTYQCFKS